MHFDVLVKDYTHQNHIHFLQTDLSKMPDSKWPMLAELNENCQWSYENGRCRDGCRKWEEAKAGGESGRSLDDRC